MPMNVQDGESREEFLGRCIPEMIGTGSDKRPREQAVAICNDIWRNKDFCQDPDTGLLCGSDPAGGSDAPSSNGGKPGASEDKPSSDKPSKGGDYSSLKTMPKEIEGVSIEKKPLAGGMLAIGGSSGIAVSTSRAAAAAWKDMKAYQAKAYAAGWMSSAHPNHTIWHELAHVKVKQGSPDHDSFLSNLRGGSNPTFAKMAAKVSRYAGTNGHEMLAEVFAGVRAGRKFDADVMDYYDKVLRGPKP